MLFGLSDAGTPRLAIGSSAAIRPAAIATARLDAAENVRQHQHPARRASINCQSCARLSTWQEKPSSRRRARNAAHVGDTLGRASGGFVAHATGAKRGLGRGDTSDGVGHVIWNVEA